MSSPKMTPMMQQYLDCKSRYPDALLFFRLGDFYEMFFEDAEVVSRELGLTLTSRSKGEEVPMAGVPHHASQGYISQLITKGFTVAVAEQLEDAATTKGMVKRDVVRVVTPGMVTDTDNLEARTPNYVAAIDTMGEGFGMGFGLAFLDISTGDFRATEVSSLGDLLAELHRIEAKEILYPEYAAGHMEKLASQLEGAFLRPKHPAYFDPDGLLRQVTKGPRLGELLEHDAYFHDHEAVAALLAGAGQVEFGSPELVMSAAAGVLRYVVKTQRGVPSNVRPVSPYRAASFLTIDEATKANLELTQTLMGSKRQGSLLGIIDHTVTSMGGRRLRQWLSYPLVDLASIQNRHEAVEELVTHPALREDLRQALGEVYDIERLCGRVSGGSATARDLRSLLLTLETIPQIKDILGECQASLFATLDEGLDLCEDLCARIDKAIVDDPPGVLTEGGLFKLGFDPKLDDLLDASLHGKDWMLRYETEQKEATGIASLKVKYNKVFGYYIEVTRANFDLVPDDYIRKQTLSNAERYFTPELKEMEEKVLGADDLRRAMEYELFEALRREVASHINRLMRTASELANLDVLGGLAELAIRRGYVRPVMTLGGELVIEEGRHPVVETTMKDGEKFVPNGVHLGQKRQLGIITGPNMAGKSTVIRQVALVVLLAQIGSFVPAKRAEIGLVDKIFSRVGASDNLAKGQSTFMVEMTETAHILNNATSRSLIILDEIGRGTATYDGLSIAWAVAEHLHHQIGAKTLFATHYHELTELAEDLPHAFNMSIAVKEWKEDIIFLRKLIDGPANRSYGIQVGRLAGLPGGVVERAKAILELLEAGHFDQVQALGAPAREKVATSTHPPTAASQEGLSVKAALSGRESSDSGAPSTPKPQLSLFSPAGTPASPKELEALTMLREVSVGTMTPIEAMVLLDKLARLVG